MLVAHFFGVALFGVSRLLFPRPSVKGVLSSVALIYTACCIILPIVRSEVRLSVICVVCLLRLGCLGCLPRRPISLSSRRSE